MKNLKTIKIKGKDYVEVNERLRYFRENFNGYSLSTDLIHYDDGACVVKATITYEDGFVIATGIAHETKDSSYINKTSFVENCETSAWGRALANFGIGIKTSVASAEEVNMAIAKSNSISPIPVKPVKKKATSKVFNSMLESIEKGNGDLVRTHMGKYDMTDAQIKTLTDKLK